MNSKNFILFVTVATLFYWWLNPAYIEKKLVEDDSIVQEVEVDSTVTVSFSTVGDIMCHSTQYNYAWVEKDSFDFNPVFGVVGDYLREKDILIGNLETILAGTTKNYSGYPYFNSPNELAEALKYAGFDFLTLANNHANDQGFDGLKRTLEYLRKINIIPLGASSLDSTKNYNLFVRKGLRFGLLSYTYGTNYNEQAPNPRKYINHIDPTKIKADISDLRKKNADIIIVLFHFGEQYAENISKYQKNVVDKTVELGADIIIGSHPHIIQQFEPYKTNEGNLDTGFVVYSLGNFVSNQRWKYSDGGVILNFDITKNIFTDSVYVSDISYLPIWVFKGKTDNGRDYIILPSNNYKTDSTYSYLKNEDRANMEISYFDNINQLTRKSQLPKIDILKNVD